jgi:hypothetical protein
VETRISRRMILYGAAAAVAGLTGGGLAGWDQASRAADAPRFKARVPGLAADGTEPTLPVPPANAGLLQSAVSTFAAAMNAPAPVETGYKRFTDSQGSPFVVVQTVDGYPLLLADGNPDGSWGTWKEATLPGQDLVDLPEVFRTAVPAPSRPHPNGTFRT